jgi:hypothetical protein
MRNIAILLHAGIQLGRHAAENPSALPIHAKAVTGFCDFAVELR